MVLPHVNPGEPSDLDRMRQYLGHEGEVRSPLRPSGSVDFGTDLVQVVTDGDFVEVGTRVRAIRVDTNSLIVEAIEQDE